MVVNRAQHSLILRPPVGVFLEQRSGPFAAAADMAVLVRLCTRLIRVRMCCYWRRKKACSYQDSVSSIPWISEPRYAWQGGLQIAV